MARGRDQHVGDGSGGPSAADVVSELSNWAAGGGILVVALFPFALPLIVLTAVALVPLVAVALVAGLIALPFLAVRRVLRKLNAAGPEDAMAPRPSPARRSLDVSAHASR
jgi:hypothetical protein